MLPLTLQPSTPSRPVSASGSSSSRVVFSPSFTGDAFTKTCTESSSKVRFGHASDAEMQVLWKFLDNLAQVNQENILENPARPERSEADSSPDFSRDDTDRITFLMDGVPYQMESRASEFSIDITLRSMESRPRDAQSKVYLHVDSNRLLQFADESALGAMTRQPKFPFRDLSYNAPLKQEVFNQLLDLRDRLLGPSFN